MKALKPKISLASTPEVAEKSERFLEPLPEPLVEDFALSEDQTRELGIALQQADRGEGIDGWKLLGEIRRT